MPFFPNRVEPTRAELETKTTSQPRQRLARWTVVDAAGKAIAKAEGKRAEVQARFPKATLVQITAYLNYSGRWWRLYRRSARPDDPWYIEFHRDNERTPRSLETSLLATAEAEAKSYIDAWLQRRRDERSGLAARKSTVTYATLGEVLAVLPELQIKAKPSTRRTYEMMLRIIVRRAKGLPEGAPVDHLSTAELNDALGAKYFAAMEQAAKACASQLEALKLRRTWTGEFTTAKSLFAPRAEYQMKNVHGLKLPDLAPWLKGRKIHGPQKLPKSSAFQIPDDTILARTIEEWKRIGQTPGLRIAGCEGFPHGDPLSEIDRRNMFIAIGLELSCGLRKGEVMQARENWRKTFGGVPHLSNRDVNAKDGSAEIHVVPIEPYWSILNETMDRNGWRGAPDDPWLTQQEKITHQHRSINYTTGGKSDADYWPFWLVGRWLRSLGWTTSKTNHALRDWTASYITMVYGLESASAWCRHKQLSTTQSHYNRFCSLAKQIDLKKFAWFKWAS